jgi:hypothetical protein
MPPELTRDGLLLEVDDDVLEIFLAGRIESQRIPLRWLVVRASPGSRNSVVLVIRSEDADQPLYQMVPKPDLVGFCASANIGPEEEPAYRAFFADVARLCGRSAVPPGVG